MILFRQSLLIFLLFGATNVCASKGGGNDDGNGHTYWYHQPPGRFVSTRTVDNNDNDTTPASSPFTIANMTCEFFTQPLNHFDLPRNQSGVYRQRVCFYNGFVNQHNPTFPVLLYTGNESPIEEYVNHTGLIWETAPLLGAQVVFAEHRYEGHSLPANDTPKCLAYASSFQALADFANLIENRLFRNTRRNDINNTTTPPPNQRRRPVIVLGGSYGGMLAAWMRMTYPHLVVGAIAGSAPIGGFPLDRPTAIDAAYRVIAHGLAQPYPPTAKVPPLPAPSSRSQYNTKASQNHCPDNLLAVWPLIQVLASEDTGRALLQQTFRLCDVPPPETGGQQLMAWAQSPWFDLAEGSFPYPSSYIPYALTHRAVKLPAWPLQAACWTYSSLHQDWGITFQGNVSNVVYNITYGDSGLSIAVDWDQATPNFPCQDTSGEDYDSKSTTADTATCRQRLYGSDSIRQLLSSTRDAVGIWYNLTQDVTCYNLTAAPNAPQHSSPNSRVSSNAAAAQASRHVLRQASESSGGGTGTDSNRPASEQCANRMAEGSWPLICCNEEMNLIITEAAGLGRDCFWPPTVTRGTKNYNDLVALRNNSQVYEFCQDPDGTFGFPQSPPDPWARWMDIRYGGLHLAAHSNIVFSNGLLDPWSSAGVYGRGVDPFSYRGNTTTSSTETDANWQPYHGIPGLFVQNITHNDDRMIALIMDVGGHHTDLMYSHKDDPLCISEARKVEQEYMRRWIKEFWTQQEEVIDEYLSTA